MTTDDEVLITAKRLVRAFGRDATIQAALELNRRVAAGDRAGAEWWRRVLEAIRAIWADRALPPFSRG